MQNIMKKSPPLPKKKTHHPPPTNTTKQNKAPKTKIKTIFLLKPLLSSPPTNFLKESFTFRFHYFSTYKNLASTPITMTTKKPFAKPKSLTLLILNLSPHSSSYFNALQYTLVVLFYTCVIWWHHLLTFSIFTVEVLFPRILPLTFLFLLYTSS